MTDSTRLRDFISIPREHLDSENVRRRRLLEAIERGREISDGEREEAVRACDAEALEFVMDKGPRQDLAAAARAARRTNRRGL